MAGVGWDDIGAVAGTRARPDRRAAGRPGGGQGHRRPPPPALDPREPPAGAHRRQLRPGRGGALRVPGGQRRAHVARRRRGRRALPRRGAHHGRRRRRGLRQGRPAARLGLPGRQGASRARRRPAIAVFADLPARRAARPRLQLQRPQDGAPLRPEAAHARPRSRRTAPTSRRPTRPPSCASWSTRRWPVPPPRVCVRRHRRRRGRQLGVCDVRWPERCEADAACSVSLPPLSLCTDNAGMIGLAAAFLPAAARGRTTSPGCLRQRRRGEEPRGLRGAAARSA